MSNTPEYPGNIERVAFEDERIQDVVFELLAQYERPPANDPIIKTFSIVMAETLASRPDVQRRFSGVIDRKEQHGSFSASYGANFLQRIFHYRLIDEPNWPVGYIEQEPWEDVIQATFDTAETTDEFFVFMEEHDVQSNVPERSVPIKIAVQSYGDRLSPAVRILDVAASSNLLLAAINSNAQLDPVSVLDPHKSHIDSDPGRFVVSESLSDMISSRQLGRIALGECVSVDLKPLGEYYADKWREACSMYPFERAQRAKQVMHQELKEHSQASNLLYVVGDYTQQHTNRFPGSRSIPEIPNVEPFDALVHSTWWYQLDDEGRYQAFENSLVDVADHGIVIVQDFIEPREFEPGMHPSEQLVFPANWFAKNFLYRTMIYDPREPDKGFQEFMRWNNGRCRQAALGSLGLKMLDRRTTRRP